MTGLSGASDGLLAQRAGDGDAVAFGVLARRYGSYLVAFATRLTGSRADAEDCVQEALITAWDQLHTLEDSDRVRSWLSTIVSRKAVDRIRARRPVVPIDDVEFPAAPADTPERRAVASSQIAALEQVLGGLPDEQRAVWVLKEIGEHSYEEIAEQLGVTPSTVRGRLARARRAVLEQMEEWR